MAIEDKKQQQQLKEFDQTLRESTGQLVWILYWMFAACALMVGLVLIFDGIVGRDAWVVLGYVWMIVLMDSYLLAPYRWSNESFSQRVPKTDSVAKILRFVPLSEKNYICVRMQYLWKFVWKFGAFAMLVVIGSSGFMHAFSIVKAAEGVVLFLIGPMLFGYIELKGSLSF